MHQARTNTTAHESQDTNADTDLIDDETRASMAKMNKTLDTMRILLWGVAIGLGVFWAVLLALAFAPYLRA